MVVVGQWRTLNRFVRRMNMLPFYFVCHWTPPDSSVLRVNPDEYCELSARCCYAFGCRSQIKFIENSTKHCVVVAKIDERDIK